MRIGRYLKATRDRGLVINPVCNSNGVADMLQIDNYPDADFAGMYGYEKPTDPASAKSRTGFTITDHVLRPHSTLQIATQATPDSSHGIREGPWRSQRPAVRLRSIRGPPSA